MPKNEASPAPLPLPYRDWPSDASAAIDQCIDAIGLYFRSADDESLGEEIDRRLENALTLCEHIEALNA